MNHTSIQPNSSAFQNPYNFAKNDNKSGEITFRNRWLKDNKSRKETQFAISMLRGGKTKVWKDKGIIVDRVEYKVK